MPTYRELLNQVKAEIEEIDAQAAAPALGDATTVWLDVREMNEWDEGHIPGAQHLFLGNLEQLSEGLSRDTPIVLHCQGGSRSAIGASLLRARGFTNVSNMEGGFDAWRKQGLPVEDE